MKIKSMWKELEEPATAWDVVRWLTLTMLASFLLAALVGCVAVPQTEIAIGAVKVKLPKDYQAKGLAVELQGTNFTLKADSINSTMNPAVIDASAEQIKAHYDGAARIIQLGIEGAAKGAKP